MFGTVSSWRHPWFSVTGTDGRQMRLRPARVAANLLFDPLDFLDPRLFYYDWSVFRPYLVPGGTKVDVVPRGVDSHDGFTLSAAEFRSIERERLRTGYDELAGLAMARRTEI